jgi:hypothetical protein
MRFAVALIAVLCALSGCGGKPSGAADPPPPEAAPDLSSFGRGAAAAREALVACFDEEGMWATPLEGQSDIARNAGAQAVGSVSARIGSRFVNLFEVAWNRAHARRMAREARRRGLRAVMVVGRVWYQRHKEWTPYAARVVNSCLARVDRVT